MQKFLDFFIGKRYVGTDLFFNALRLSRKYIKGNLFMCETKALPKLKVFDAEHGWRQRNEALSSFVQSNFLAKDEIVNILEAGCGRKWSLDMGDISYQLTGIDINKDAIELRKANEGDLDRAILGDLRNVNPGREGFDIVYSIDVLEHIDGAEQVLSNFFTWLKPKGLLILTFPDRDSVFTFIARVFPHWMHVLYYKYGLGSATAGKPGFGPFRAYYDKIISRSAIHDYCYRHSHNIVLEYGRPYNFKKLGRLVVLGWRISFKFLPFVSFGKLASDHSGLVYVIQKNDE